MNQPQPSPQAWDLAAEFCDGRISASGLRSLSQALRDDAGMCEWFSRYMAIHAHLQWEMAAERATKSSWESAAEPAPVGPAQLTADPASPDGSAAALLAELHALVDLLCRGIATAEQRARIEQLACGSPELRRFFVAAVQRHAGSNWRSASSTHRQTESPILGFLGASTAPPLGTHSIRLWAVAVGVALCFWGFWAYFIQSSRQPHPNRALGEVDQGVRLTQAGPECHFGQATPLEVGDQLAVGKDIDLESGQVELMFASGARGLLEGPARFEVRSDNSAFLQLGKFTARVPQRAIGFTLETPSALVVDLGTEFGIEVDAAGATQVQVFRGAVEMAATAKPSNQAGSSSPTKRRLVAGQAARILANDPSHVEPVVAKSTSIAGELPKQFELGDCSSYTQYVIRQTRPVLYWHFDEGAADTTKDAVGGRLPDIWLPLDTGLAGPLPADGFAGMDARNRAIAVERFRAIGSEHLDGVPRVPVENYSVQLWFNCSAPFGTQKLYYPMGRGSAGQGSVEIRDSIGIVGQFDQPGGLRMGQLVFYNGNSNPSRVIGGDVLVEQGRWYQLIFVRDGPQVRVFLDGDLKISAESPWLGGNGAILTFGNRADTSADFGHTGRVDEVAVWDRTLGEPEVRDLWQAAGKSHSREPGESK